MESKLTKRQRTKFVAKLDEKDRKRLIENIVCTIRYDDEFGNGHNSFEITVNAGVNLPGGWGGCCHDDIRKYFPKLAKYIKWHHMTSEGPMHYIANSLYHVRDVYEQQHFVYVTLFGREHLHGLFSDEELPVILEMIESNPDTTARVKSEDKYTCHKPDLEAARRVAVWPEAELEDFTEEKLKARLPALIEEFKKDLEELGFEY